MRLGQSTSRALQRTATVPINARVRAALDAGDIASACRLLAGELRKAPTNNRLRKQLALLRDATGDRDGAAVELTRALRLDRADREAAERLATILAQGRLTSDATLDPHGLSAALAHRTIDRDLVGAVAVDWLKLKGCLRPVIELLRKSGPDAAAQGLVNRRASPLLRDELLLTALEESIIADREIEMLLSALRRQITLALAPDRLREIDLARFAAALAAQCASNGYVLAESPTESERIAMLYENAVRALRASPQDAAPVLLYALYRDPMQLPSVRSGEVCFGERSAAPFASFLERYSGEKRAIASYSFAIERLGEISDKTSLSVKDQYEASPYPCWRGASLFPDGRYIDYLHSFFSAGELSFTDKSFDILVAGCGTGLQAVTAAIDYGPRASVTGLDISSASLGYAALMRERLGADNLSLVLGDINNLRASAPHWRGRFQVIECSGVLHHMADPFGAWLRLLDCLAPGGIMLVGLYSAAARRELDTLRREAIYPGPGCDDSSLRRYREALFARGPDATGARYLKSRDAFTTNGFRDFFLHVSERPTTIPEIASFLEANALEFRGFVNAPFATLRRRFPDEVWPGRLSRWRDLESEQPDLFIGMYQFWISRK